MSGSRVFAAPALLYYQDAQGYSVGVSAAYSLPVAPRAAQTLTMTPVTVPAGVSTLAIAANPARKSLQLINIGTGFATAKSFPAAGTGGMPPTAPGQASATSNAVVLGQGYPLEVASAAGHQGGSTPIYDGAGVSTDEWDVIAQNATTILVVEGN